MYNPRPSGDVLEPITSKVEASLVRGELLLMLISSRCLLLLLRCTRTYTA
jgi:hypothetical protein